MTLPARTAAVAVALVIGFAGATGCGGGDDDASGRAGAQVDVFADSALKPAFVRARTAVTIGQTRDSIPWMGSVYANDVKTKLTVAPTKQLAARIRRGAKADVIVGDADVVDALYTAGLVREPIRVASTGHDQVLIIKRSEEVHIKGVADVARRHVRLAIGTDASRVGRDTRRALGRLPAAQRRAVLANARAQESTAAAIVDAVRRGTVDAGFVHESEANAACCKKKPLVYAVGLPSSTRDPTREIGAALVIGAAHPHESQELIYGLLDGNSAGFRGLQGSGFRGGTPIKKRPRKPPVITKTGV